MTHPLSPHQHAFVRNGAGLLACSCGLTPDNLASAVDDVDEAIPDVPNDAYPVHADDPQPSEEPEEGSSAVNPPPSQRPSPSPSTSPSRSA